MAEYLKMQVYVGRYLKDQILVCLFFIDVEAEATFEQHKVGPGDRLFGVMTAK